MRNQLSHYLTKAMLRPFGQLLEAYGAFGQFLHKGEALSPSLPPCKIL
jgi:hypothetical protein